MATQIQWRRGTTAQTASFTGAVGEATVDTSKNTLVIHDGTTAGGFPLARESALSANVAQIQASFNQANTAFIAATSAGIYANGAFVSSNTIQTYVTSANANISLLFSYVNTANANITAAFNKANSALALTGGTIAGNVTANSVIANNSIYSPIYYSPGGLSRLELTDIGIVGIGVAGQTYQFGGSGLESNQGMFGGSFGGNRLSLNNETNLISNRYDTVKIQTGTDGTIVNEFVFANNSLTVPGGITVGGINVVPTLASSFSTANAAFTRANNSISANAGGTITGDLVVTGNLTISGTTTYANTQQLLVGDNLITLNAELPTSVTPVESAGIEINRGNTFANSSLLWVESAGKWQANTGSATGAYFLADEAATTSAGIYANGAFTQANTDVTNVSVAAGTYGNTTHYGVVTVAANGRVTSVSTFAVSDPSSLAFSIALG
jgi:hypothetical protein